MTTIRNHQLIELHPDTIETVRKMYNLHDPKKMEEAIDILEAWVEKQNHFLERKLPRQYLESNIIGNKGSIERAKTKLDKLFTLRTIFPHLYEFSNIRNDFKKLFSCVRLLPLPKLTRDHYRIFTIKFESNEFFFSTPFTDYYIMFAIYFEYMKMHDYSNGCVFICDYRHINVMDVVTRFNLIELKQFATIILDGYGLRIKGIHLITPSKAVESLVMILRPLFGQKIGQRIYVHKDMDSLYEYYPKNILPVEYGGTERSLDELQDDWIDLLSTEESTEYLNWTKKTRVNESYRLTDKYDEYVGMSGTFRNMNVD